MKVLEFDGYGPNAPRVYLPAQNIISFYLIYFNGNHGTNIDLPEGRYIRVGALPEDVKKQLESALLQEVKDQRIAELVAILERQEAYYLGERQQLAALREAGNRLISAIKNGLSQDELEAMEEFELLQEVK